MGKLGTCYLLPHPPIIIPDIGAGQEDRVKNTVKSMEEVAGSISQDKPDTIIIITPHGPIFRDAVAIGIQERYRGSFKKFGHPEISLSFEGDIRVSYDIMRKAAQDNIPVLAVDTVTANKYNIPPEIDHGSLVPLYFISKRYQKFKLVQITYGLLTNIELYRLGKCIQQVIEDGDKDITVIASGDLSHRLTHDAPAGYSSKGVEFDKKLIYHLDHMEVQDIVNMDPDFLEEAGECGYRSVLMLLGVLDGYDVESRILSYEGPFGVGYCVASFKPVRKDSRREFIEIIERGIRKEVEAIRGKEDMYVKLARQALEYYVKHKRVMEVPHDLPEEMIKNKAGVFVSIKKGGHLRGCIGTIEPITDSIAQEIIHNAISAGTRDPRFLPVTERELKDLVYSVDVLSEPEPIQSLDQLDVKKYGVIVRAGRRSGLLLPDIEGVDTPEDQVRIALQKAGISPSEPYTLERFEVIRHR